jgi:hypothetical protein
MSSRWTPWSSTWIDGRVRLENEDWSPTLRAARHPRRAGTPRSPNFRDPETDEV